MARFLIPALVCLCAAAADAAAQPAAPAEEAPVSFFGERKKDPPKPQPTPTTLAISLSFSSATWAAVGISTDAPHVEIARLLHRKRYRFELIQMILLAEAAGKSFDYVDARHDKKMRLRDLAQEFGVDFDSLYERAVAKRREVEKRAEEVARVRGAPVPRSP
ncbi:MAG: hypothetical protein ABIJ96_02005 [Elusimicrobiota bacterium]